jgi:dihydropteroate synthase
MGADMINDISGGNFDSAMYPTVAEYQAPYIAMHIKGTPQTMQQDPTYNDVVEEVYQELSQKIANAYQAGIHDIIIDPGFGFGKTLQHNKDLLRRLSAFTFLQRPIMVGISRKSMLRKILNVDTHDTVLGANVLHYQALQAGANILRVHDVAPARQVVKLYEAFAHDTI